MVMIIIIIILIIIIIIIIIIIMKGLVTLRRMANLSSTPYDKGPNFPRPSPFTNQI